MLPRGQRQGVCLLEMLLRQPRRLACLRPYSTHVGALLSPTPFVMTLCAIGSTSGAVSTGFVSLHRDYTILAPTIFLTDQCQIWEATTHAGKKYDTEEDCTGADYCWNASSGTTIAPLENAGEEGVTPNCYRKNIR